MEKADDDWEKAGGPGVHPPSCQCWLCTRPPALYLSGALVVVILGTLYGLNKHDPEVFLLVICSYFFYMLRAYLP